MSYELGGVSGLSLGFVVDRGASGVTTGFGVGGRVGLSVWLWARWRNSMCSCCWIVSCQWSKLPTHKAGGWPSVGLLIRSLMGGGAKAVFLTNAATCS
jgi:hypothetical protein